MSNGQADPVDSVTPGVLAQRIEVRPERFEGWIESFASQHGELTADLEPTAVTFRTADGSAARCTIPFPPLPAGAGPIAERLARHALAERTVGVLLVRLGGYAAGVFTGDRLVASKVGSRLVHGRSAAGGTSQRRFARRRENQAHQALAAAADTAAAIFGPYSGQLDAVVLGGDRRAIAPMRSDARLAPYFDLAVEAFLTVPDPRLTVLRGTPRLFRAIRITVTQPGRLS